MLLVITGLASGGATNVVLGLASHFNNHPDFDIQLLTGPIHEGRTDVTYFAYEQGISTQVIPSLINHINPFINVKAVADWDSSDTSGSHQVSITINSDLLPVGVFPTGDRLGLIAKDRLEMKRSQNKVAAAVFAENRVDIT